VTIRAGDKAPVAAGVIHSDFEKSFISAETVAYDDWWPAGVLREPGNWGSCGPKGKNMWCRTGMLSSLRRSCSRIVLCAACLPAPLLLAQFGVIHGVVVNPGGQPVPRATIELVVIPRHPMMNASFYLKTAVSRIRIAAERYFQSSFR